MKLHLAITINHLKLVKGMRYSSIASELPTVALAWMPAELSPANSI